MTDDDFSEDFVDPLVRQVAALLPFRTILVADMGGPTMLQIELGRRGADDDPPDTASIDPTTEPVLWAFDVEGGRETVVSNFGIDTEPQAVADWIASMAERYSSPAALRAMELELSTSPSATWVWAADKGEAETLRASLTAAGHEASAAHGGNAEGRTLDIDIGAIALEGLRFLLDAGYSFRWHFGQHPLNRAELLYGIPVARPRRG